MAWPDWEGPSFPTEWDDIPSTILWSLFSSGIYYGFYRWELLRTLGRMPQHAYHNPSKRAIFRQAASRTTYPTFARSVGLMFNLGGLSLALPLVATGAAVGWAATAEHHGAVTPGVASGIGMPMTPDLYSEGTSSNPAGWDLSSWNPFN